MSEGVNGKKIIICRQAGGDYHLPAIIIYSLLHYYTTTPQQQVYYYNRNLSTISIIIIIPHIILALTLTEDNSKLFVN